MRNDRGLDEGGGTIGFVSPFSSRFRSVFAGGCFFGVEERRFGPVFGSDSFFVPLPRSEPGATVFFSGGRMGWLSFGLYSVPVSVGLQLSDFCRIFVREAWPGS